MTGAEFFSTVFNGLFHATTLFLMAAGLSLIFGVTRIVNFAHGSFYMLGALMSAYLLTAWMPVLSETLWGYLIAIFLGAISAGLAGAISEFLLFRRMKNAPELYLLVLTFGLTLLIQDALRFSLGPDEVFAPRVPHIKGALEIAGQFFPLWHGVIICLGPLVWIGLHILLKHSQFGKRLQAATDDREMLSALGINPAPLMLGAVVLGCFLAGFAGALVLPTEPANLQMDLRMVVETFVVVVTGGLGSITGAFLAALLIGLVHAFGVMFVPQATLVLVFVTMAVVLALRPEGLMGAKLAKMHVENAQIFNFYPEKQTRKAIILIVILSLIAAAWSGDYWRSLVLDALILAVFGLSLQLMMGLSGLVSFGHAAWFGLGAYVAALTHTHWGANLPLALFSACLVAVFFAAILGAAVVRSAGVYLAMLSLAFAQVVWATASQWVILTGGDNGLIGLQLVKSETQMLFYGWVCCVALFAIAALYWISKSRFGAALQALRDVPERSLASGLAVNRLKYMVFIQSAVLAAFAGALFAAHKGSVFPSVASVAMSVDALLVVLLGGVHWLWGALAGAFLLTFLQAELSRGFEYWRGALGLAIIALMLFAPQGLGGLFKWRKTQA